jgi:hypothetical protein
MMALRAGIFQPKSLGMVNVQSKNPLMQMQVYERPVCSFDLR